MSYSTHCNTTSFRDIWLSLCHWCSGNKQKFILEALTFNVSVYGHYLFTTSLSAFSKINCVWDLSCVTLQCKMNYFRLSLYPSDFQKIITSTLASIPGILAFHNDTIISDPATDVPGTSSTSLIMHSFQEMIMTYTSIICFPGSPKDPMELSIGQCYSCSPK